MKIPFSWLKTYIPTQLSAEEVAEKLTMAGLEVDAIEPSALGFEGVVVGEVREAKQHPDADKLSVATVFDGKEEHEVVCGAPNCRTGMKTAFAPLGASIQGKKIKKGKLRGVTSHGMLCSEVELGIGSNDEGIAELDLPVGQDLSEIYGDVVFEISLTPNLGHCFSILGVARELAAMTGEKLTLPDIPLNNGQSQATVPVKIESPDCARYACCVIEDVKVGPSPDWLKKWLEASGIRSINNIVDVTNYVMLEIGQPMHAFDLDQVKEIVVRPSKPGETLKTLDGVERRLEPETLVIANLALAGVMGGEASEVSEKTTRILLEAAHFSPQAVRKTCKFTMMSTESSKRFERGCDPEQVITALHQACSLIEGRAGKVVDHYKPFPKKKIAVRTDRTNRILGTQLSESEIESILGRLDFFLEDGAYVVPSYRSDITQEIDLIEEVGRLYGFNNIPKRPARYVSSDLPHTAQYLFEQELRAALIGQGLTEMINSTLVKTKVLDHSALRSSLMPGLLEVVAHNQRQQIFDIAGFEIGQVHFPKKEEGAVGLIMAGEFLELKGVLENVLETLFIPATFKRSSFPELHPGRQASVLSGVIGEVHPKHLKDVEGRISYCELDLGELMKHRTKKQFEALPQYPGSERDWTVTLAEDVAYGDVTDAIDKVPSKLLKSRSLVSIYRSDEVGEGWKNMTLRFLYRDDRKTVAQKAVEGEHQRIITNVIQQVRCKS